MRGHGNARSVAGAVKIVRPAELNSARRVLWRRFWERKRSWQASRASISRFLRSMALKPHRVRYWLNPSDPDFDKKAARICRLYVSPPAKATVLSLDEKPGVQTLRRTHRDLPLRVA